MQGHMNKYHLVTILNALNNKAKDQKDKDQVKKNETKTKVEENE